MLLVNPSAVRDLLSPMGSSPLGYGTGVTSGESFVGVLDGLTANAWDVWSQGRRLVSTYTGAIKRVRESTGNTEANIGSLANGDLDKAAMQSFCGAGDGFCRTMFGQLNGNDFVQASASQQPRVVASGVAEVSTSGLATARWDNSNDVMSATVASPFTDVTLIVSAKLTATNFFDVVVAFRTEEMLLRENGGEDWPEIYYGSGSITGQQGYPITGWHVWSVQISSTNGTASLWYDGTPFGSVSGKTIPNMPSLFLGGRNSAGSNGWNGCISEKALFNSIIGNTQRQAVEAAFLAAL